MATPSKKPEAKAAGKVQGEGDYESAKKFDEAEAAFVKSGRVGQAARDAKPTTQEEADAMAKAEAIGKSKSRGEDPSARRAGAGSATSSGKTRK